MALPLPDLDDRRWADLVEEARSLIPVYAPGWTDHNVHDPGITQIDLLAWVTEADLYAVNRVRDAHRRRFLSLVGVRPAGPSPARVPLRFDQVADSAADVVRLPAGTEVVTGHRPPRLLRTAAAVDVQPARLVTVTVDGPTGPGDLTVRWQQGHAVPLLGAAPGHGSALILGFDRPLVPATMLRLFVRLDPAEHGEHRSDDTERRRILAELAAARAGCPPPRPRCGSPSAGTDLTPGADDVATPATPAHHSVGLVWEFRGPGGAWYPVDRVDDETRGFTLDGHVAVHLPPTPAMEAAPAGPGRAERYELRCRVVRGAFDAAPMARLLANAVEAAQAVRTDSTWDVPAGIPVPEALEPGEAVALDVRFEPRPTQLATGSVARLSTLSLAHPPGAQQPALRVLRYEPPQQGRPGRLDVEAAWLGQAHGLPYERFELDESVPLPETLEVFTVADGKWREWSRRDDHLGSRRDDRHYVLDPDDGAVVFGDGERGRVAPPGSDVLVTYLVTEAAAGRLAPGEVAAINDSLHNEVLFADLPDTRAAVRVTNPMASTGGADAETLDDALGRAFVAREERTRAVTLDDCQALALATPGSRIARARAWADVDPHLPCHTASGVVTVVVVPWLPVDRPAPSDGLRRLVQAFVDRRTLLGTRLVVTGPTYRTVSVRARVRVTPGAGPAAVAERASAALDAFFDPLHGGPDGDGWPLGRGVFRSEVLQVLDDTAGVDHVNALEIVLDGGEASCGNACLAPTELVSADGHHIEVIR